MVTKDDNCIRLIMSKTPKEFFVSAIIVAAGKFAEETGIEGEELFGKFNKDLQKLGERVGERFEQYLRERNIKVITFEMAARES